MTIDREDDKVVYDDGDVDVDTDMDVVVDVAAADKENNLLGRSAKITESAGPTCLETLRMQQLSAAQLSSLSFFKYVCIYIYILHTHMCVYVCMHMYIYLSVDI